MNDVVFDKEMRPVFVDDPPEVLRRLNGHVPESWTKVCIGETGSVVSIPEYLYKDKHARVQTMIKDVIKKNQMAFYRRKPERMDNYIESTALKIIELVLREGQ